MPIRWDKFTVKAQEAVQRANQLASEHGNPELRPIHLLAALLEDKEGIVPPVLEKIGIGPQAVLAEVYNEIDTLPKVSGEAAQAHKAIAVAATVRPRASARAPACRIFSIGLSLVWKGQEARVLSVSAIGPWPRT